MRFELNQKLFGIHFGYTEEQRCVYGFFALPLLFDTIIPTDINFIQLTVTEHHKVHNEHANQQEAPDCDGYLLKDVNNRVFSNQYPTASYGQVSDEGNRRFRTHCFHADYQGEDALEKPLKELEENPKLIFEYHLLSDVLEKIQKGINDLGDVPDTNPNYEASLEKRDLLAAFYERIVKEFHEKYPEYRLFMEWKPAFKKSTLIWPNVSFHKRISVEKAKTMSKEEILQDFTNDGRFEVAYEGDDRLIIEQTNGQWQLNNELTDLNVIQVFFGEFVEAEGEKEIAYHSVVQTSFFPQDWQALAVDAFFERLHSDAAWRNNDTSMSLEAISAREKAPDSKEIVQVKSNL